jgi:hypothetical protein
MRWFLLSAVVLAAGVALLSTLVCAAERVLGDGDHAEEEEPVQPPATPEAWNPSLQWDDDAPPVLRRVTAHEGREFGESDAFALVFWPPDTRH